MGLIANIKSEQQTQPQGGLISRIKAEQGTQQRIPTGTLLGPLQEGVSGLKTLYGGGEQGIARKLANDISEGAKDYAGPAGIKQLLGPTKAGFRVAGDVAGTVFAPVAAAFNVATGGQFNKAFSQIQQNVEQGKGAIGSIVNKITDIPAVQKFALARPNLEEDFNRLLNLAFAAGETGKIEPKTALPRTQQQISSVYNQAKQYPQTVKSNIEFLKTQKIKSGFEEQNQRLKTAQRSFNENTITRTENGKTTKVTPVDTLAEFKVVPEVEKGTINMGDYNQGVGPLGKLKAQVNKLDIELEDLLTSKGKGVSLDTYKNEVIKKIKSNPKLKESGKISTTIKKLDTVFDDFKQSYGDKISEVDINKIRRTMNYDYNPETIDVSRVIGDASREIIYNVTTNKQARSLLRKQGEILAAKNYAEIINGTKVTGGRLGNYVMRTLGALIGTSSNIPFVGPIAGAIGGEFAARAMQQSQFGLNPKGFVQSLGPELQSKSIQATKSPISTSNIINQSIPETSFIDKGISETKTALTDFAKNPKLGLSIENVAKKLGKEDINLMTKFIDDVRLRGSLKPDISLSEERTLFKLNDLLGIKHNASAQSIANKYENIISKIKK